MIIDAHVHLKHGDAAGTEHPVETIIEVMDAASIDRSVVFAMSTTAEHAIEMASAAVAKYPERLIPYAYSLPSYERPVLEILREAIVNRGFKGIKVHAGECRLTDYIADPVFRLAGELGVPCLVDFGGDLQTARRLATAFPATKLIIAHFGRYLCVDPVLMRNCLQIAEECPNVWVDASGVVMPWIIREGVARIGAARIMFGSDGPHTVPDFVSFARDPLTQIQALKLRPEDEALVLGEAAARLLGLEQPAASQKDE